MKIGFLWGVFVMGLMNFFGMVLVIGWWECSGVVWVGGL